MNISPIRVVSTVIAAVVIAVIVGMGALLLDLWINGYDRITVPRQVARIALLAPFEGADRAIGYEALTAARAAFAAVDDIWLELLPIDSGDGQAAERLRALAGDPLVVTVLLTGIPVDEALIDAAGDLPLLLIDQPGDAVRGGRVLVIQGGSVPDHLADLYRAADQYAPPPGDLAPRAYIAANQAIGAARMARSGSPRDVVYERLMACCE
jgi:hypothetical protein